MITIFMNDDDDDDDDDNDGYDDFFSCGYMCLYNRLFDTHNRMHEHSLHTLFI